MTSSRGAASVAGEGAGTVASAAPSRDRTWSSIPSLRAVSAAVRPREQHLPQQGAQDPFQQRHESQRPRDGRGYVIEGDYKREE